jgi:hypothetical protein
MVHGLSFAGQQGLVSVSLHTFSHNWKIKPTSLSLFKQKMQSCVIATFSECLLPSEFPKQLTDFQGIWYEYYAIRSNLNFHTFEFLQSVTTFCAEELVMWEQN